MVIICLFRVDVMVYKLYKIGGRRGGGYYLNWFVLKERKKWVFIKIIDKNLYFIWGDGLIWKWYFFLNIGNYIVCILFNESKIDR